MDNPYRASAMPTAAVGRLQIFSLFPSTKRFAMLGVIVGIGFGFAAFAYWIRLIFFSYRTLDEPRVADNYMAPLMAFAGWSVVTCVLFGLVGASLGLFADLTRLMRSPKIGEVGDPTKSSVGCENDP